MTKGFRSVWMSISGSSTSSKCHPSNSRLRTAQVFGKSRIFEKPRARTNGWSLSRHVCDALSS